MNVAQHGTPRPCTSQRTKRGGKPKTTCPRSNSILSAAMNPLHDFLPPSRPPSWLYIGLEGTGNANKYRFEKEEEERRRALGGYPSQVVERSRGPSLSPPAPISVSTTLVRAKKMLEERVSSFPPLYPPSVPLGIAIAVPRLQFFRCPPVRWPRTIFGPSCTPPDLCPSCKVQMVKSHRTFSTKFNSFCISQVEKARFSSRA